MHTDALVPGLSHCKTYLKEKTLSQGISEVAYLATAVLENEIYKSLLAEFGMQRRVSAGSPLKFMTLYLSSKPSLLLLYP